MKITNIAEGVVFTGKLIHTMPKNVLPNKSDITAFYDIPEDDNRFKYVHVEMKYDRMVLAKPEGGYVVIPRNENRYKFED